MKTLVILIGLICYCNSIESDKGSTNRVVTESALHPSILEHLLHVELNRHIQILGNVSDEKTFLKRIFLDEGHKRAATVLQDWMHQAGLSTRRDPFGNVRGRFEGVMGGPAMLVGSHYDTVIDGGIYDGAMGILVGIAAAKAIILEAAVERGIVQNDRLLSSLNQSTRDLDLMKMIDGNISGNLLPRSLEIVGFSDEEGVRFQSTFLGSRGLAGYFTEDMLSNIEDAHGRTFLDFLYGAKMARNVEEVLDTAVDKEEFAGYLEVHLEQGPMLERNQQQLGVVSGISGQYRVHVSISGEQGHAGTVMKMRKDPMAGAAFLINYLENLCVNVSTRDEESSRENSKEDESLVCTVGSLNVWPGASNVIPGKVNFTVDIRSIADWSRNGVLKTFREKLIDECSERNLTCSFEVLHRAKAVHMDQDLTERLEAAIRLSQEENGTCQADSSVPKLSSGAGHDAMALSEICPVSMMFVRCKGGVSHRPDEFVDPLDVFAAARAAFHFLRSWIYSNTRMQ